MDGSPSEMSYASILQYPNSQLIAHRFAYNPGISLDVLLTMNVESIPGAHFDASIYSNILRCCVDVGMGKIVITCFS